MQFPAEFVTFTEVILNGKLHFLCSMKLVYQKLNWYVNHYGKVYSKRAYPLLPYTVTWTNYG